MTKEPDRSAPSWVWYLVTAALIAVGVGWPIFGVVSSIGSLISQADELQRVPLPGEGEVSFTQPGPYVMYYEGPGANSGGPAFNALLVAPGGEVTVPISEYQGRFTYNVAGRSGTAVGRFDIDTPGTYLLRTQASTDPRTASVAVGPDLGGDLVVNVVVPLCAAYVLLQAGAGLAVFVGIRRCRAQRSALVSTAGAYPVAPFAPPPAAPSTELPGVWPSAPAPAGAPWIGVGGPPPPVAAPPGYSAAPPGYSAARPGFNGDAIASLVFALVGWFPLALLFGSTALRDIGRHGGRGRGMAIAGLVIAAVFLLLIALVVGVIVVALA